jgi:hypothetical protein
MHNKSSNFAKLALFKAKRSDCQDSPPAILAAYFKERKIPRWILRSLL